MRTVLCKRWPGRVPDGTLLQLPNGDRRRVIATRECGSAACGNDHFLALFAGVWGTLSQDSLSIEKRDWKFGWRVVREVSDAP